MMKLRRVYVPVTVFFLSLLLLAGCHFPGKKGETEEALSDKISLPGYIPYEEVTISAAELENRYYYSLLDEENQGVYCEILQGIREHKEVITTHGTDPDLVNRDFTLVYLDWPELFWIDGTVDTTGYSGFVNYSEVCPRYLYDEETSESRSRKIEERADQLLAGLDRNQSSYDQICYVYCKLIEQTDYVTDAEDNQNICSVFLNGETVCAGYARSFQYLMNRLGLFSIYVTGSIKDGDSHAWNIVRLGEEYYNVDVTWGDPVFATEESGEAALPEELIYYDFLCCSDAELADTHRVSGEYPVPACTMDDMEYYRLHGRYFGEIGQEELLNLLKQDIDQGCAYSEIKLDSAEHYQLVAGYLDQLLEDAAYYLCDVYQLSRVTYYYSRDPLTNKYIVFWKYDPV